MGGWNKGLTKETDKRVARTASKLRGKPSWNSGLTKEIDSRIKSPWNTNLTKEKSSKITEIFSIGRLGIKNPNWKGGRISKNDNYILVKLQPDNLFYLMADSRGYCCEHRLIIAKELGRRLQSWEIVHHINGIRNDNRRENLELTIKEKHNLGYQKGYEIGYRMGYQDGYQKGKINGES